MPRLLGPSVATSTGLYARCGDGWRQLQPTRTPLGVALAELLASGVEPCPACEKFACQCPDPDPHGNLAVFAHEEIPY
jgi:hypothetical protein